MATGDETVGERLALTLELFEFGVSMRTAQLRRAHPTASAAEIDGMVEAWLAERPGAETGDGPGVPVSLDRFAILRDLPGDAAPAALRERLWVGSPVARR